MTIDLQRYKRRRDKIRRRGGRFWRPESGSVTAVRFFLFRHEIIDADFKVQRYESQDEKEVGDTVEELDCPLLVHIIKGSPVQVCEKIVGGACEFCDEAESMGEEGNRRRAKDQHAMNLVIMDVDKKKGERKMTVWTAPTSVYEKVLGFITSGEYSDLFGCKGRDFLIDYNKDRGPSEMYQIRLRDSEKSEELPSLLKKQVKDLMSEPKYYPTSLQEDLDSGPPVPEAEEEVSGGTPVSIVGRVATDRRDGTVVTIKSEPDGRGDLDIQDEAGDLFEANMDDLDIAEEDEIPFEDDESGDEPEETDGNALIGKVIKFEGDGGSLKGQVVKVLRNGNLEVNQLKRGKVVDVWEVEMEAVQAVVKD